MVPLRERADCARNLGESNMEQNQMTTQTTESLMHDLAHYRELERLFTNPAAIEAARKAGDTIEAVLLEREGITPAQDDKAIRAR